MNHYSVKRIMAALLAMSTTSCATVNRQTFPEDPGVVCYFIEPGLWTPPALSCVDRGAPDDALPKRRPDRR